MLSRTARLSRWAAPLRSKVAHAVASPAVSHTAPATVSSSVVSAPARSLMGNVSTDMLVSLSMNFNNSGTTQTELCDNLRKNSLVTTPLLEYAVRKTDRADFDPAPLPYEDKPHDIGCGATITSAHMHCIALEALSPAFVPEHVPGRPATPARARSVLDVGSGSGYVAAVVGNVFHALRANPASAAAAAASRVVGVDIAPGLVAQAADNVTAANSALTVATIGATPGGAATEATPEALTAAQSADVTFLCGDGFSADVALPHGPFDAIHCGVASTRVPVSLLARLKAGGKAVIPVQIPGSIEQELLTFTRKSSAPQQTDSSSRSVDYSEPLTPPPSAGDEVAVAAWIEQNFNKSFIMRCIYSMNTVNNNANTVVSAKTAGEAVVPPAINPRLSRLANGTAAGVAGSKFAHYFRPGAAGAGSDGVGDDVLTPAERAAAADKLRAERKAEHEATVSRLAADLATKQQALEQTATEVRRWQEAFVAANGGARPSMVDMVNDVKAAKLLSLVKELRTQVSRAERSLDAVQSKKM